MRVPTTLYLSDDPVRLARWPVRVLFLIALLDLLFGSGRIALLTFGACLGIAGYLLILMFRGYTDQDTTLEEAPAHEN